MGESLKFDWEGGVHKKIHGVSMGGLKWCS